jgi:sugar lactone lactonase YvrE
MKTGIKNLIWNARISLTLGSTDIFAIHVDRDDNIWIGSFTGGAEVYDKHGNLKRIYRFDPEATDAFPGNDIRAITK